MSILLLILIADEDHLNINAEFVGGMSSLLDAGQFSLDQVHCQHFILVASSRSGSDTRQ